MTRSDILFKHLWAGTVTILRMTIRTMVHFYIKYMKPIKRRIICSNFSQKYQLLSVIHVSIILFDFDLILYVPSTIFQLNRTGLPGLNQY